MPPEPSGSLTKQLEMPRKGASPLADKVVELKLGNLGQFRHTPRTSLDRYSLLARAHAEHLVGLVLALLV